METDESSIDRVDKTVNIFGIFVKLSKIKGEKVQKLTS